MTVVTETLQVSGIRCERCVNRLAAALGGHERPREREREPDGRRDALVGRRADGPRRPARGDVARGFSRDRPGLSVRGWPRAEYGRRPARCSGFVKTIGYGSPVSEPEPAIEARGIAAGARDRVRFEEEALASRGSGLPGRPEARRLTRRGRGLGAGDLRKGVPELAARTPRHEPARLAPADPHEPQHRPRPPRPADAGHPAARGRPTTTSRTRSPRRRASRRSTRSASSSVCRKIRS